MADFVILLYNPSSRKRHDYLEKACNMMLEYKQKIRSAELSDRSEETGRRAGSLH